MENLIPAENMGVSDSSPILIAIQVEPHMKQRIAYARNVFTANLFIIIPSWQLIPVLSPIWNHHACKNEEFLHIRKSIILILEYYYF